MGFGRVEGTWFGGPVTGLAAYISGVISVESDSPL